jgi:hypothetical protein
MPVDPCQFSYEIPGRATEPGCAKKMTADEAIGRELET